LGDGPRRVCLGRGGLAACGSEAVLIGVVLGSFIVSGPDQTSHDR
jgi:hypothetical protein